MLKDIDFSVACRLDYTDAQQTHLCWRKKAARTHLDAMEPLDLNLLHGFGDRVPTISRAPVDVDTHEEVGVKIVCSANSV
jgi:hypothetical protein